MSLCVVVLFHEYPVIRIDFFPLALPQHVLVSVVAYFFVWILFLFVCSILRPGGRFIKISLASLSTFDILKLIVVVVWCCRCCCCFVAAASTATASATTATAVVVVFVAAAAAAPRCDRAL